MNPDVDLSGINREITNIKDMVYNGYLEIERKRLIIDLLTLDRKKFTYSAKAEPPSRRGFIQLSYKVTGYNSRDLINIKNAVKIMTTSTSSRSVNNSDNGGWNRSWVTYTGLFIVNNNTQLTIHGVRNDSKQLYIEYALF